MRPKQGLVRGDLQDSRAAMGETLSQHVFILQCLINLVVVNICQLLRVTMVFVTKRRDEINRLSHLCVELKMADQCLHTINLLD